MVTGVVIVSGGQVIVTVEESIVAVQPGGIWCTKVSCPTSGTARSKTVISLASVLGCRIEVSMKLSDDASFYLLDYLLVALFIGCVAIASTGFLIH